MLVLFYAPSELAAVSVIMYTTMIYYLLIARTEVNIMRRKLDKELIVSFGALALLFAVGILFLFLFIFDVDIAENLAGIVGSYSGISGGIWLLLLCRNC